MEGVNEVIASLEVNASLEVKDNTPTNSKTFVYNFINFDNFERSDNF